MLNKLRPIAALAGLGLVAGCTSGNGALEPSFTSVNLNATVKAQIAVGVATFADGTNGLNVVATLRQKNGESGTLLNTPTITGPSGFVVPAGSVGTKSNAGAFAECAANVDAGTNHISGSVQSVVTANATCSTFGQGGGLFGYGFAPENSTTAQSPNFTLYGDLLDATTGGQYGGPFYGPDGLIDGGFTAYRGGAPAYPNVQNGTYPSGFLGYGLGYTTFDLTPVAGAYNLSVFVGSGNTSSTTINAATPGTLTNTVGLPAFAAAPVFTEDGAGGGTATCIAPAGTTETLIELVDVDIDAFYTQVVSGGGAVSYTFGDAMGPAPTTSSAPTIAAGDDYEVGCIAADYPLYEAGYPQNTSQTPTLVGAAGQTDIAFAPAFVSVYGGAAASSHKHKLPAFHRVRSTKLVR